MNLTELKKMPVPALVELAQSMEIEGIGRSRKHRFRTNVNFTCVRALF